MSAAMSGSASAVLLAVVCCPVGSAFSAVLCSASSCVGSALAAGLSLRVRAVVGTQGDHPERDQAGEDHRDEPGQRPQGPPPASPRLPRRTGGRASGRALRLDRSGSGGDRREGRGAARGGRPELGASEQDRCRVPVATGGECGQLVPDLRHLRPVGRVGGQHPGERAGQRSGPSRRQDVPARHLVQHGEGVLLHAEGRLPLDAGVERRAEGEDVAGLGHRLPLRDLGREEGRGTGDLAGLGEGDVAAGVRDPEVGDLDQALDPAALADEDVGRLHVAVHDPRRVGGGERVRHLGADLRDLVHAQRAVLAEHRCETAGGQVFHDQPRLARLQCDVVDGDRVRMAQPRGDPALPQRPLALLVGFRRADPDRRQDLLDRHLPAQQFVAGQPHGAHPATTELGLEPVPAGDEAAGGGDRAGHLVDAAAQTADGTPKRRAYSSWAPAGRAS